MIEGLKVTVQGKELKDLANTRAAHHEERASVYAAQIGSMEAARVEPVAGMSSGDPVAALKVKHAQHEADGRELRFIASHLNVSEVYLLNRDDLSRLGIVTSRW